MFHVNALIGDITFVATFTSEGDFLTSAPDGERVQHWKVVLFDGLTGKSFLGRWSLPELTAILALGIGSVGEDDTPGYQIDTLYKVAAPALKGCPRECYPIP